MSDHWTAKGLAGLGENTHEHGLGLGLALNQDYNHNQDHNHLSALDHKSSTSTSISNPLTSATSFPQEPDELDSEQGTSNINPALTLSIPKQKHFRQIIQEHPAFKILNSYDDQEIQSYIAFSDEELAAINGLRHVVRSTSNSNRHLSQSSTQSSNSHSNVSASSSSNYGSGVGSLRSVAGSSISSIESHPRNYQRVARNTPRNSLYQQPLSDNKPDDDSLNPLPTPQCSYWCTVCKYPRRFQTCGGWIKHEKEDHEGTVYVCMPDGPTSFTQHGLICVLCGSPNPDEKHMETHNIASCMDKGLTARTYKRKYQILKHLESHMVPKGSDVASGWRRRCNKKAWACGLCVAYFAKATDRFHHIATQHYERGEGIDKWDTSKVILGLLQQSRLHRAWTERLQFQFPDGEIPDLRWDKNPNGSLITMLELGLLATEDPQPLAMEAFLQSDYSQACHQTQSISAVPPPISEGSPKEKTSEIVQDSHRPSDNTHGLGPHVPVKGEIFVAPLFRVQSFSQPGNFLWPDPMLFDPNDALDCEMDNASSSLAYMTTSYNEGLTEVEPSNLPASRDDSGRRQSQDNLPLNSRSLSLSPQTERVHSKFATDRPMSSMEIDTDLESLTRALLNEQARHEAQMNRWDTNLS